MYEQSISVASPVAAAVALVAEGPRGAQSPDSDAPIWPRVAKELAQLPHLLTASAAADAADAAGAPGQMSEIILHAAEGVAAMAGDLGREFIFDLVEDAPVGPSSDALRAALGVVLEGVLGTGRGPIRVRSRLQAPAGSAGPYGAVDVSGEKMDLPEGHRRRAWELLRAEGRAISFIAEQDLSRVQIRFPLGARANG